MKLGKVLATILGIPVRVTPAPCNGRRRPNPRKRRPRPSVRHTKTHGQHNWATRTGSKVQYPGPPAWKTRFQGGTGGNSLVAFHGTPSAQNAADIMKNGFLAGNGNALGAGVYFSTDLNEAKGYARGGVYLKCAIRLGRTATWDNGLAQRFQAWCQRRNVPSDPNARTAFLLHEGFDTLRSGKVLVVLRPLFANPAAHKVKLRQVRVLGVFRADNDQKIRV